MTHWNTLIDAATVAAHLGRPDWVVLDCRFDLARPDWGAQQYASAHLPGAHYAHLDRDLAGPVGPTTGRHPLPAPADFAARVRRWGIDAETQVIVHDQGNGMYAARAWWLLRWMGHMRVALLDGGFAAWTEAGLPVSADVTTPTPSQFAGQPDMSRVVDVDALQGALAAGGTQVSDARGADRFAGQNETVDPVAGHVPGAVNHPFMRNLNAQGRFLPAAELRNRWLATLAGHGPQQHIAMCGSGVSACHNLLALEHAGLGGSRLYPGSWSEWIRDSSRPVATGPA
ncbi:MAG: sulfurtransferase [Steroidobacteraceae bacterium]